jgi:hypothetical protein
MNKQISHINPLNAELNPICHLLELLGAHHNFHVSRVRVNFSNTAFGGGKRSQNFEKTTVSSCHVFLSVRMEQLDFHWSDFI